MSLSLHEGFLGVIEILLYVIGSGGAAVTAAIITSRHTQRLAQPVRDQVNAIASSVNNGHDSPLREDIDDIRAAIRDVRTEQTAMRADVAEMREELRIERDDIVELQQKVADIKPAAAKPAVRRKRASTDE